MDRSQVALILRELSVLLLGGAQQPSVFHRRAEDAIAALETIDACDPARDHANSVMLNVGYLVPARRACDMRDALEEARRLREERGVDVSWREFAQLPIVDRDFLRDLSALLDDLAERLQPSVAPPQFVPNRDQRAILDALTAKALTKQQLAAAVFRDEGAGSRLYNGKTRKGDLNELRDLGLVDHKNKLGFYRPDSPPKRGDSPNPP